MAPPMAKNNQADTLSPPAIIWQTDCWQHLNPIRSWIQSNPMTPTGTNAIQSCSNLGRPVPTQHVLYRKQATHMIATSQHATPQFLHPHMTQPISLSLSLALMLSKILVRPAANKSTRKHSRLPTHLPLQVYLVPADTLRAAAAEQLRSRVGQRVYLVPGDTFRAAAAEQLAEWAKRANVTVGAFQDRAKPQKVIAQVHANAALCNGPCPHDVIAEVILEMNIKKRLNGRDRIVPVLSLARAHGCETALKDGSYDVVICDTAGRLHTAYALMEELEMTERRTQSLVAVYWYTHALMEAHQCSFLQACKKAIGTSTGNQSQPDEVLLVLDGTTGMEECCKI
eukprot:1147943-Pelagomonas_calceolata.AAC.8